jgi:hypothetical protein
VIFCDTAPLPLQECHVLFEWPPRVFYNPTLKKYDIITYSCGAEENNETYLSSNHDEVRR